MAMIFTNQGSLSLSTRPIPSKNHKTTFSPHISCAEQLVSTLFISRPPLFGLSLRQPHRRSQILLHQNLSVCFPPECSPCFVCSLSYQTRPRVFQRVEHYSFHHMCHLDGIRMLYLYGHTLSIWQQNLAISFPSAAHCE